MNFDDIIKKYNLKERIYYHKNKPCYFYSFNDYEFICRTENYIKIATKCEIMNNILTLYNYEKVYSTDIEKIILNTLKIIKEHKIKQKIYDIEKDFHK